MLGIQPVALAMTCFSLKQWTPLHLAAREGHMNTVEFLINNGADINIQDTDEVSRVSDLYSYTLFLCEFGIELESQVLGMSIMPSVIV